MLQNASIAWGRRRGPRLPGFAGASEEDVQWTFHGVSVRETATTFNQTVHLPHSKDMQVFEFLVPGLRQCILVEHECPAKDVAIHRVSALLHLRAARIEDIDIDHACDYTYASIVEHLKARDSDFASKRYTDLNLSTLGIIDIDTGMPIEKMPSHLKQVATMPEMYDVWGLQLADGSLDYPHRCARIREKLRVGSLAAWVFKRWAYATPALDGKSCESHELPPKFMEQDTRARRTPLPGAVLPPTPEDAARDLELALERGFFRLADGTQVPLFAANKISDVSRSTARVHVNTAGELIVSVTDFSSPLLPFKKVFMEDIRHLISTGHLLVLPKATYFEMNTEKLNMQAKHLN